MQYEVEVNGRFRQVNVHRADLHFVVGLDGREWTIDAARIDAHVLSLLVGTASHEVIVTTDPVSGQLAIGVDGTPVSAALNGRRRWGRNDAAKVGTGPQRIVAPMPGKVVRVLVATGDVVEARQGLVVIEAMKMENELRASRPGTIAELQVQEGQSVDAGALLMVVAST